MKLEKASKEEMKEEALERLNLLKINKNVIKEFKEKNILNKSEGILGSLYWLDEKEEEMVRKYEQRWNVVVYHIILTNTINNGKIYDLLFISDEKQYWLEERLRLKAGYVLSHTYSQFSESGDILVKSRKGGLVRVY